MDRRHWYPDFFPTLLAIGAWVMYVASIGIDFLRGCNPFITQSCERYAGSLDHVILRVGNLPGILTPVHRIFPSLISETGLLVTPTFLGAFIDMSVALASVVLLNIIYVWFSKLMK